MPEEVRANLALFEVRQKDAIHAPRKANHVEGVKLHLVIMLAAVQAVEVRYPVNAEKHRLAVDHKRAVSIPERGLNNQRIAIGPVVAVSREKAHALALALNNQTVAI